MKLRGSMYRDASAQTLKQMKEFVLLLDTAAKSLSDRAHALEDTDATFETELQSLTATVQSLVPSPGTVSIGGGLISNSMISVSTNWVDIPNTQPRGAYLILARGEDDEDSALVASVSDNSDFEVGYVNVMARKGDTTTNYYLAVQYPASSNVQIKMNNGNARNVYIMVIRA